MKTSLTNEQIKFILKNGKKTIVDKMTIIISKKVEKETKYAIIISKKNIKTSVERNKIKRMFREAIKKTKIPKISFLIICKNNKYTQKQIISSLEKIFKVVL